MKVKSVLLTTVLAVALSLSSNVSANKPEGFEGKVKTMPMLRALSKLDLTEEQKQNIKAVVKQNREVNQIYRADRKQFKTQMQQLMTAAAWDENFAQSLIQAQMEQGKEVELNIAKTRNQVFNLLTKEQQDALLEKINSPKNKERNGKKNKKVKLNKLSKFLDLSEMQIAQIKALREAAKLEMDTIRLKDMNVRENFTSVVLSESFDEARWLALQESVNDTKAEHKLIRTKLRYDTLSVLSESQKEKFKKISKRMKEKGRRAGSI